MSSATDFDFFMGSWTVRNRYLGERLRGSEDWEEFEATSDVRPLPGVLGNEDEFRTEALGGFVGMSFRFFDPEAGRWSIYWADSRRPGVLDPPVFGGFANGAASSRAPTSSAASRSSSASPGRASTPGRPRWEQAFSGDGGETWEPNWVMEFARR